MSIISNKLKEVELLSITLDLWPVGITIIDEHIYTTDGGDSVYKYQSDGTFVRHWDVIFPRSLYNIRNCKGSLFVLQVDVYIERTIIGYSACGQKKITSE